MKKGFTLFEVLLVSAILVILLTGVFSAMYVGQMSGGFGGGALDLQQEVRRATTGMLREIRQARPMNMTITSNNTQITFQVPTSLAGGTITYSNNISYFYNATTRSIFRSYSAAGAVANTIGQNIGSITFTCLGGANATDCTHSKMVQISIVANTTVRGTPFFFNLTETERMRNG